MSANFSNNPLDTVQSVLTDSLGNTTLAICTAANLPSGKSGYSVGCIAMASDTGVCYSNTGSLTSSTFTAFNSASALTLPSAFTDASTTTGSSFQITGNSITSGNGVNLVLGGLTSGNGVLVTGSTANLTTGAALFKGDLVAGIAGNGLVIVTTGAYTGTGLATLTAGAMTTGVGLSVVSTTGLTTGSLIRATTSTAGAIATNGAVSLTATGAFTSTASTLGFVHVAGASTVTGTIMSILGGAQTTGIALNITDPSAGMTSGSLLRTITATTGAVATNGINSFQGSGAFTGTGGLLRVSASATATGSTAVISAPATTTGLITTIVATAATLTTGRYLSLNDTTTGEVFGIGTNGHLISTASASVPTIGTNSTGISACAITAGGTDTCGVVTTTGTPSSGTVLTITFGKTYTTAPKAVLYAPTNAAAGGVNTMPIITTTATTAVFTWPAGGVYAATPSFMYFVIA